MLFLIKLQVLVVLVIELEPNLYEASLRQLYNHINYRRSIRGFFGHSTAELSLNRCRKQVVIIYQYRICSTILKQ